MMPKALPPESPDAYIASIDGWRRRLADLIRSAARAQRVLEETIKWGHIVYFRNGPVCLIRVEEQRVLFGFWRGKRMVELEPRLKPSGKYEMGTLELREGMTLSKARAASLIRAAVKLNETLGNPQLAAVRQR